MIKELLIYGKRDSIFSGILGKSATIDGRYHVSKNYGRDLNTDNLEDFIKDPKYGLVNPEQKYPIAVCMAPVSSFRRVNGTKWEVFYFTLFFLARDKYDGANQVKQLDPDTNVSMQTVPEDWSLMKQCGADFLEALNRVIRSHSVGETPLRTMMELDYEGGQVKRYAGFGNDMVNGASLTFTITAFTDACAMNDYPSDLTISIPSTWT